jgi:hypothetical protein
MNRSRRQPGASAAGASLLLAALAACGRGGGGGHAGGGGNPPPANLNPNVGLAQLERFDRLAELPARVRHDHFGGYDLTGGNDDGFSGYDSLTGNRAFLYFDGSEFVLLDVEGAGVLHRMNFAYLGGATTPAKWYTAGADDFLVRFYFDGETTPRVEGTMEEITSGAKSGFPPPLVGGEFASSGGPFSYLPLPFESRLRISTTGLPHFFNFDLELFPTAAGVQTYQSSDDPSAAVAVFESAGSDPKPGGANDLSIAGTTTVPASATATLASIGEEGRVTAILLRPLDGLPLSTLRDVRLRVAYDGEATPRVDAPIGLLFGTGFSPQPVECLGFGRKPDGTGYLYFPMPFHASAQVSVANGTPGPVPLSYEVRWRPGAYGAPFGYFGATHAVFTATTSGNDVPLLDRTGHGKLVGVVLDMTTPDPPLGRVLLEGDERIFVDDVRSPAVHGTATETFFNWGWYEGPLEGPFERPTHGYPWHSLVAGQDQTSCYRLMFGDAIPFYRRIEFGLQHGGLNEAPGLYEAVVFTYAVDAPSIVQTDEVDPGAPTSELAHGYFATPVPTLRTLTSVFEGREWIPVTEDGYLVGGASGFTVSILPSNAGVRLVRLSDQSLGRQRAQVLVDGVSAGFWYEARTNPSSRWREDVFEIPSSLTAGKSSISIDLVPTAAGTSWNEFRYRVYSRLTP